MKEVISTEHAPKAIGPYSQGIRYGNLVFVSGQIGALPDTGAIVEGDIKVQTEQVLKNLNAVLEKAGSSLDKVVKTTVFITNMSNFQAMNEVYARFFIESYPARSTIEVSRLPRDVMVEIEAVATI